MAVEKAAQNAEDFGLVQTPNPLPSRLTFCTYKYGLLCSKHKEYVTAFFQLALHQRMETDPGQMER